MEKYIYGDRLCNWLYTFYKNTYRFRIDPVPGSGNFHNAIGTKYMNNGHGKGTPWKKAYTRDKLYQQEIRKKYGITFTMPDFIPCKRNSTLQRTWKRSKKSAQWMKYSNKTIISNKLKGMKTSEIYTSHIF